MARRWTHGELSQLARFVVSQETYMQIGRNLDRSAAGVKSMIEGRSGNDNFNYLKSEVMKYLDLRNIRVDTKVPVQPIDVINGKIKLKSLLEVISEMEDNPIGRTTYGRSYWEPKVEKAATTAKSAWDRLMGTSTSKDSVSATPVDAPKAFSTAKPLTSDQLAQAFAKKAPAKKAKAAEPTPKVEAVKKPNRHNQLWSTTDDALVKRLFMNDEPIETIAQALERTVPAVLSRLALQGLIFFREDGYYVTKLYYKVL